VLDLLDAWERHGPAEAELGAAGDISQDADDAELPPLCRRHRLGLI
jgi:hypothetical protein